jgi:signal transduction histidine kinase
MESIARPARRHAASRVDLFVEPADDRVHVRVVDDGAGVPVAACERIFERFISIDGKGGSGLGLPIGRALARAQGGDLSYDRKRGFVLVLPLKGGAKGDNGSGAKGESRTGDRTMALSDPSHAGTLAEE